MLGKCSNQCASCYIQKIPLLLMRFASITCTASYSEIFPSCVLKNRYFKKKKKFILSEQLLFKLSIFVLMAVILYKMLDLYVKKKLRYLFTTSV